MARSPKIVAYEGAVAQMHRAAKIAAAKLQGMGWKAQLETIANAMVANEIAYGNFKGKQL